MSPETRTKLVTYFADCALDKRHYEETSPLVTTIAACQGCGKRTRGGGLCPDCLTAIAEELERSTQ